MDEKDLKVIGAFMELYKAKGYKTLRTVPLQLNHKDGWISSIDDKPDLQLKLCSLVIALRNSRMGDTAASAFSEALKVEGAFEFLATFAVESFAMNVGLSKVETEVLRGEDTIKIRLVDLHIAYEHLPQFKLALQAAINQKGGVTKVAKRAKMSQPALSNLLNTSIVPRQTTIQKLYEALGIDYIEMSNRGGRQK